MPTKLEQKTAEFLEFVAKNETIIRSTKAVSSVVDLRPGECKNLCEKVEVKFHDGLEKRVVAYRLTDMTVDHHNEIVKAKGVDLKIFKSNPVILGFHNGHKFPVGKAIKTVYNKEARSVDAWVLFFDDVIDDTGVSESFFKMAGQGGMTKGSIGFTAKGDDVRRASPDEQDEFGIDKYGWIWDKITLLEFSLVSVPANPNAGQIASMKDAFSGKALDFIKTVGQPKESTETDSAVIEETLEAIAIKPKYTLYIERNIATERRSNILDSVKKLSETFDVEIIDGKSEPVNEKISNDTITKTKNILKLIEELKSPLEDILKQADPEEEVTTKKTPVQNDSDVDAEVELHEANDAIDKSLKALSDL